MIGGADKQPRPTGKAPRHGVGILGLAPAITLIAFGLPIMAGLLAPSCRPGAICRASVASNSASRPGAR